MGAHRRGRGVLPRVGLRPVGARLGRRRRHPHALRVRRPGAVPVVLPVAGDVPGPPAEPLLLDRDVPPRRDQPVGPDVGDGPHRAADPGDLAVRARGLLQRGVDPRPGPHGPTHVRGAAPLGALAPGRLPRRPALRVLALRAGQPGVRPPHDGGPHAVAADPGRARRDPGAAAPRRPPGRRGPGPLGLRPVLPERRVAGGGHRAHRLLRGRPGRRRPTWPIGSGCGCWRPTPARRSAWGRWSAGCCWPIRSSSPSLGPAHLSGVVWPDIATLDGIDPLVVRRPRPEQHPVRRRGLRGLWGKPTSLGELSRLGAHHRAGRRHRRLVPGPAALVLRSAPGHLRGLLLRPAQRARGCRPGCSPTSRWSTTSSRSASWPSASWPPPSWWP